MKRPQLNPVPVPTMEQMQDAPLCITMDPGQWDKMLEAAYNIGGFLLEVEDEQVVRAFQLKPNQ